MPYNRHLDSHTDAISDLRKDFDEFVIEVEEKEIEASEVVNSVSLPGGIEIPIPKPEILVAAGNDSHRFCGSDALSDQRI